MAQLILRGLEEEVESRLRDRAARHGQSMEAEARDILRDALHRDEQDQVGLGTRISGRFEGIGFGPDEGIAEFRGVELKDPFDG